MKLSRDCADRTDTPLISIIVATYNCAGVLPRCLASIARQTYAARELIVVDGASSDATLEVIKANAAAIRHWESAPDRGVYDAWNKALPRAQGEWIVFLGADDRFHDDRALARMASVLAQAYPKSRFVYGCLDIVAGDGQVIETVRRPWGELKPQFLAGTLMLPHAGAFHHRSLFAERGPFDASFRLAGDYDLLLRELQTTDPVYVADQTVRYGRWRHDRLPQNLYRGLRNRAREQRPALFPGSGAAPPAGFRRPPDFPHTGRAHQCVADAYRRLGAANQMDRRRAQSGTQGMIVAVTGGSGFTGNVCCATSGARRRVRVLSRRASRRLRGREVIAVIWRRSDATGTLAEGADAFTTARGRFANWPHAASA